MEKRGLVPGWSMEKKGMIAVAAALLSVLVWPASPAGAVDVAGVKVPGTVTMEETGEKLVLQGAGVRKKLIVKVYVAALYLTSKAGGVPQILDAPGGKRVTMTFLYKEVDGAKLVEAWEEGFAANLSGVEREAQGGNIALFNSFFQTVRRGDEYRLDYVEGKGTVVRLNSRVAGVVPGEGFYRALLKVWLGPHPADKGLQKAWLGG